MTPSNYIYIPSSTITEEFRCRVPLQGAQQLFVVNGKIQGTDKPFTLYLQKGKAMKEILQVIGIRTKDSALSLSFEENFHFEQGSSGNLVLCSHTFSLDKFLTEEKVNITLEENASADIVLMQNEHNGAEHNSTFNITLAAGSTLKIVFLSLHGGKIQNNVKVLLNGENATCDLSGLYIVDGKQVVKNDINLVHRSPKCSSHQLFKGILDDSSTSWFSGIIKVLPNAQKTEAYQANHNLLISNEAKIYSQPQLEIYADDVKCSHGATSGRLNKEELFYMRSRGISLKEAKLLQQLAFTYSVLEKISNSGLRDRMFNLTESRLKGEFSNCKNCSKNCC